MNIFNNNQHEPARLEPTHKICISILLIMIGYAAGTGHIFSSEANRYEHMNQIVLYFGGVIPWVE